MSDTTNSVGLFSAQRTITLNYEEAVARMGDKEVYLEIAHYFASHLQESLQSLGRCLEEGRMTEATRLAHSMKGNCATVGADELRDLCYTLEKLCRSEEREAAQALFMEIAPLLLLLKDRLLTLPTGSSLQD